MISSRVAARISSEQVCTSSPDSLLHPWTCCHDMCTLMLRVSNPSPYHQCSLPCVANACVSTSSSTPCLRQSTHIQPTSSKNKKNPPPPILKLSENSTQNAALYPESTKSRGSLSHSSPHQIARLSPRLQPQRSTWIAQVASICVATTIPSGTHSTRIDLVQVFFVLLSNATQCIVKPP